MPQTHGERGMFHAAEIQELIGEEIERITHMCRARTRKLAPEVHAETFDETLNIAAGQMPDLEEAA